MANATISLYKNVKNTKDAMPVPLSIFLDDIQNGKWQDKVLPLRALPEAQRVEEKKKVPCVTISGQFADRKDNGAGDHSGFIGIDIDDVDPEDVKLTLAGNPYVYAMFTSISGKGLCVIMRIVPEKHREAFAGIAAYLYNDYRLIIDPTSVNPSRARFISYDPHLFLNETASVFKQYVKEKAPKKVEQFVFAQNDFEALIQEIQRRGVNICEAYHDWLRCGFALAEKFGEAGRSYFHVVSANSSKYKPADADRQYNNCMKARGAKIATIATFYYYCKQAGLSIYSKQTLTIMSAGVHGKKGGLNVKSVVKNLQQFEQIPTAESEPIIEQVFNSAIENVPDENEIEQLEQWLVHNYNLRKNEITRYIENNGAVMRQEDFNTIYIQAKKVFDKLSYDMLERLINSGFTPRYNPLVSFFDSYNSLQPTGLIDKLFDCIATDHFEFARYFGRKWMVGMIAAIHGEHNPYMLVLVGKEQGTGKTEFFRRLLPDELRPYYAESKLDAGKDDEILMTQKLLIMDDEMGGKNKKDSQRLKELLSRQTFSLREPYGRNNVDLNRIASLCGTTNDEAILNDPTGNRRIIPIGVYSINHDDYNKVNKRELFMEAYHLWKGGFDWHLNKSDIKRLNDSTLRFESYSLEYELITQHYELPEPSRITDCFTATQIKNFLETHSVQKLSLDKIGKELQRIGFKQISKRINGFPKKVWEVIAKTT
jgi:predicted P-loop ATPase